MSLKSVIKSEDPTSEVTNDELIVEGDKPQDANIYEGATEE